MNHTMKKFISFSLILIASKSFSQTQPHKPVPIITAKEAYKHVGELVVVRDSIYNGKIMNDSTAAFQVGKETTTPILTITFILSARFRPIDKKTIIALQRNKVELYSIIKGSKKAPEIIIHHDTDEFSFWNLPSR